MDKTFTWLEFLSMSEIELNSPIAQSEGEIGCSVSELSAPSPESLDEIMSFVRIYETLETVSVGYAELFLN